MKKYKDHSPGVQRKKTIKTLGVHSLKPSVL